MHLTKPKVFLIAKTEVLNEGMSEWLEHIGAPNYEFWSSDSDAENLIMAAAKRCYMAFEVGLNPNITSVRKDLKIYLENILKSGHGSVLEHATFSFAIEGVSRVFTGEMNRHRAGMAISEGSMRFISFDDLGLVETISMETAEDKFDTLINIFLETSFREDEVAYRNLITGMRTHGYDDLSFDRKKKLTSKIRRAIGMGISTGGVWTGNVRALRHICELRGAEGVEEEILEVSQQILFIMMKECPNLFGDFSSKDGKFYAPLYSKV